MTDVEVAVSDAVRRLLDLLAADASSEQLAHAPIAGLSDAERAELARATEVALRIRHTLTEHRRRETELRALFDTASDLSKLRDLDAVLRSIVHRARMLLRVDLSYLSLNNEAAGTTYMRVTDGSVSSLLPSLRIGHGEGLGGLVAQSAHPYASADYLSDSRFAHTSTIDDAVTAERMVGILGVPLMLGSKVIGVLFAADRQRREFTAEEVALLSSLADHAAIAIDNAQLLDETRRANKTISANNQAMHRAEDAHDRLMELVLRGGDVAEVAAEVAAVLDGGIIFFDATGAELARVGSTTGRSVSGHADPTGTRRFGESRFATGDATPPDAGWTTGEPGRVPTGAGWTTDPIAGSGQASTDSGTGAGRATDPTAGSDRAATDSDTGPGWTAGSPTGSGRATAESGTGSGWTTGPATGAGRTATGPGTGSGQATDSTAGSGRTIGSGRATTGPGTGSGQAAGSPAGSGWTTSPATGSRQAGAETGGGAGRGPGAGSVVGSGRGATDAAAAGVVVGTSSAATRSGFAGAMAAHVTWPEEAVAASRAAGRAVRVGDQWVCAVLAGPELLGSLVLTGRPSLDEADRRLFERASVVAALLLLLRRSVAKAEDEVRGELLTDLLTAPTRNPTALLARGRRLGVDLAAPHAVLIAHVDGVSRRRLAMACGRYATLVGLHAEQVVLMVDGDPAELAPRLAGSLSTAVEAPVTVGASGPAAGPAALATAFDEARRCVRSLLALGRVGHGAALADLGFVGQLIGDRTDLGGYVRATLGPVLDYDERRGTDLVATLRAYFECGANLTRAKDVLHVHVNTVVQRLDRIASLLGADWQTPDRALEIQIALRLHQLHG